MKRGMRRMKWAAAMAVALFVPAIGYNASTAAAQEKTGSGEGQSSELLAEVRDVFAPLPDKMPGSENDTEARIALGKKLYFETAISVNRTQSCNSCHRLDEKLGGVDNLPTSEGAEGKFGDRNAPTTLNAGLHIAQFWDGRAADLAEQAKGPVLNPIEMGMANEGAVQPLRPLVTGPRRQRIVSRRKMTGRVRWTWSFQGKVGIYSSVTNPPPSCCICSSPRLPVGSPCPRS